MFSFISMNWRGKPLASYETIIKLIGATKTKKGLRVQRISKNLINGKVYILLVL